MQNFPSYDAQFNIYLTAVFELNFSVADVQTKIRHNSKKKKNLKILILF